MPSDPPPKEPSQPLSPRDLGWRERLAASILGLGGVGVGGTGIFLSDNQAGTTTILLIGALFLLLGVQGTAILKVGKEGAELERRAASRALTKQAVEAVEEKKDPEQAADLADAARQVDPAIANDPTFGYLNSAIFHLRAFNTISRALVELKEAGELTLPKGAVTVMGPETRTASGWRPDALIRTVDGKDLLYIEMKSFNIASTPSSNRQLLGVTQRMRRHLQEHPEAKGLLLIEGGSLVRVGGPMVDGRLEVVGWFNEDDTSQVKEALKRLLAD